jgi:hypothetical protein
VRHQRSAYVLVTVVIGLGLLAHVGLAPTFEIFGSVVAGIALLVTGQSWRTRPRALSLVPSPNGSPLTVSTTEET